FSEQSLIAKNSLSRALQYLHEILTLLGEDRRKLPALVVLFLGVSLLDLAGLGLIAPYIALVMKPESLLEGWLGELLSSLGGPIDRETLLLGLSGLLVVLFLGKAIAALGINDVIIRFAQNQQIHLRTRLMHAYQHLPYPVYLQRNSAEYVHSVQGLTGQFQGVLQQLLLTLSNGLVALVILGLLLWENATALGLLVALVGSTLFVYDRLFRRRMREYGQRQNLAAREMVQGIHEGLEGLKEIRILGRERHFHQMLRRGAEGWSFNQRRNLIIQQAPRYLLEAVLVIFVVLLVLFTLSTEAAVESLLGTLGLFGVAAIRLMPMASQLAATLTTLRFQRDAVSRLYADVQQLSTQGSIIQRQSNAATSQFLKLQLKDVGYRYPNTRQDALLDLDLEIRAGESIGLIGPSGSGKTTLVDVLLGLLEPQTGMLEYNGHPLQETLAEWRSQVAYLPQQVFLIDNTLRCNVALGEEESEIEELRLQEALRQARLSELVEQLPQGVNTILGERGVRLSGGQRQRVALARAFYHGRSVLVMDEATSALDNETEREIVAEIQRLKGQKTMIVIAHRLSTVQHCDRIYRLEHGRIVEVGTPQEVLSEVS
ncbi:MAG: ABC transporter ATP-binding protein, partial [Deltaproteobacteria bacterium]